jgi:hypothetical protein
MIERALAWSSLLLVLAPPLAAAAAGAAPAGAAPMGAPSRPAEKGCAWRKISDGALGLEAWVEPCDFGSRKVRCQVAKRALVMDWSDSGIDPQPVVEVLALGKDESAEAGMRRIFLQHTDPKVAKQCELRRYTEGVAPRVGAERYNFVPDAAYQKRLDAKKEDGVPDPPCGDWGIAPDGIQYFEAQPASGAHKVLFVRYGQDQPLFDEETLRLLPSPAAPAKPATH